MRDYKHSRGDAITIIQMETDISTSARIRLTLRPKEEVISLSSMDSLLEPINFYQLYKEEPTFTLNFWKTIQEYIVTIK